MDEDKLKQFFFDILKISSISGDEKELAIYLYNFLKKMKVPVVLKDDNVIVHFKTGSDTLLHFNAHMDTVNTDPKSWDSDPLEPKEDGKKICGLGASDEKASIVSLVNTIDLLKDNPPCDLCFAFVVKEELDGSGTSSFLDLFTKKYSYKNQACVLTEPTSLKAVEQGHRGGIFFKITAKGEGGHASNPNNKNNAFLKIMKCAHILEKMDLKKYEDSILGVPTIAIGTMISSGNSPNVIPETCYMICDLRTTPAMHKDAIVIIQSAIGDLAEVTYYSKPTDPSLTGNDEVILQLVKKEANAKITVAMGADDACFYTKKGIPSVVIGPGEKSCIHKPNEFVIWEKVPLASKLYVQIAKKFAKINNNVQNETFIN